MYFFEENQIKLKFLTMNTPLKLNLGSEKPYYVLLGKKPTNIDKLNQVINEYYKPENKTTGDY